MATNDASSTARQEAQRRGGVIDQEAVSRAVRSLEARGEKVTQASVREALGGRGSLSTIGPLLRAHRLEMRTRASESLEKHVPANLREALIAAFQVARDEARRECAEELAESRELHEEDARAIANLEHDNAQLHDEVAALQVEIQELRTAAARAEAAHIALDTEREVRLTKAAAAAAAADNARRDIERKFYHSETLVRVYEEAKDAANEACQNERLRRETADKAVSDSAAKLARVEGLLAAREEEKHAALQALEAERQGRKAAETAAATVAAKLGRAEAQIETLTAGWEAEKQAATKALKFEREALDAESKAREAEARAAAVAMANVENQKINITRLEHDLDVVRRELEQVRRAFHDAQMGTLKNQSTPTAVGKDADSKSSEHNQRQKNKERGP